MSSGKALAVILCCTALVGCMTAQPQMLWARMDGQKSSGNPQFEQDFAQARYACLSQVVPLQNSAPPMPAQVTVNQSVQIGGVAPPPPVQSFDSSAFVAAGEAGERRQANNALFESCMNARGYHLIPAPQAG